MKRLFDLLLVFFSLPLLLPILFIVAVMVRVKLGSPIFLFRSDLENMQTV